MKIGIVEWNIGCGGGRHSTMLAFGECLYEAGCDVSVFSQLSKPASEILHFYGCQSLESGCLVDTPLQRRYDAFEIPPLWKAQDLLIVSYGGWGHIQQFVNTPVVAWTIHPAQGRDLSCTRYWTNSHTTANRLLADKRWMDAPVEIVIPPHDYGMFRRSARPWHDRKYDVALVGAAIPSKRLVDAVRLTTKADCRTGIAVKTCQPTAATFDVQQNIIQKLKQFNCDIFVNLDRWSVAALLGNSKMYFSLSNDESCSLVVYESMNAGCVPIVYNVGAATEQLGDCGAVISSEKEATAALKNPPQYSYTVHRGMQFDRRFVLPDLLAAVERAIEK